MFKTTIKSLLFVVLAIIPFTFFGQENNGTQEKPNNNHYWYLGFDEGATLLFGDNKPGNYLQTVRPELGIHGGFNFAKHFQAYLRLSAGTLRGELSNTLKIENASFVGLDLNLSVDLISLFWGYNADRVFGLKPHVGFGQLQYQTRAIVNGQTVWVGYDISTGSAKGNGIANRKVVWEVPMGVEFEFNLNRKCALFLDVMTTYTDTDRLDAYASGKHYDWFSAGTIGFRYKFRKNDPVPPCPECEPCGPDAVNCPECQDAINKAVEDALNEYKKAQEEAMEAEEEEADETNELANFEEKDIHLTFKVGKAEVVDNKANQDEVNKVSDDINNGRQISNIKTVGYASPEGNDEQNQKLSEDRAQATADYIQKKLGDDAKGIEFDAKGMGSDWDGFYKALAESNIADKDMIANKIKNSDNPTATLNQMKAQYPELGEILNTLRVTRVYINK